MQGNTGLKNMLLNEDPSPSLNQLSMRLREFYPLDDIIHAAQETIENIRKSAKGPYEPNVYEAALYITYAGMYKAAMDVLHDSNYQILE